MTVVCTEESLIRLVTFQSEARGTREETFAKYLTIVRADRVP